MEKIALDSNFLDKKVAAKKVFDSNLLLGEKTVRASAPNSENFVSKSGENPWSALRAARTWVGSKPERVIAEPEVGLEPTTTRLQNGSSTN